MAKQAHEHKQARQAQRAGGNLVQSPQAVPQGATGGDLVFEHSNPVLVLCLKSAHSIECVHTPSICVRPKTRLKYLVSVSAYMSPVSCIYVPSISYQRTAHTSREEEEEVEEVEVVVVDSISAQRMHHRPTFASHVRLVDVEVGRGLLGCAGAGGGGARAGGGREGGS